MTKPYIGGQAVIEGVMMRSPKSFVVAVRRPDGQIAIREQKWEILLGRLPFLRWPLLRGALVLLESLHNGFSALKFSAEHGLPPEEQGKKSSSLATKLLALGLFLWADSPESPAPSSKEPAAKANNESTLMLVLATAMMVTLFIALPHLLTWALGLWLGPALDSKGALFHVVDGVFRVGILVGYIFAISRTQEAARLFQYHGAEHKAIWTYESDKALKVSEAKPFTTRHPRCGTSFLFIVVGVAVTLHVILLPFVPRLHPNEFLHQLLLVFVKIPMAFPIAGIAYELQRWSAKESCPRAITMLTRPGIWMQSVTTKEPEDGQLEIALLSLEKAMDREHGRTTRAEGVNLYPDFAAAKAA